MGFSKNIRRTVSFFFGILLAGFGDAYAGSANFSVGLENQLYQAPTQPIDFPFLNLGMDFTSRSQIGPVKASETEYQGDLLLRISPTHPKAWALTSRNLYWGEQDQNPESPLRFTFGRRLMGWSKIDTLWSLGQIEPLDQWDRLRPTTQGLTGIFAYTETQKLSFRFFVSGIALPETTPNVVIENQAFQAEHPQAIASAPQTFTLLNQSVQARYTLDIPSLDKIIFRPSVLVSMETKREIPLGLKLVYGYLPLNYFPIALLGSLAISSGQVEVNLQPRILNHHVYNGEMSYRFTDQLSFGAIALVDQPVSDLIQANYTTTPLTPSYSFSPYLEYTDTTLSMALSYLRVLGGLDADVGPAKRDDSSLFSSRMLYRNATQIQIKKRLFSESPLDPTVAFKYIHEFSILGDWIAGDLFLKIKPQLTLVLGGDILSSYLDVSPERGAEFLADMRSLGRARLGVNYVF